MEAASRPPLEALPDLPVEQSLDSDKSRSDPGAAPRASAAAPKAAARPRDPEQTGLNFIDPEMFLAPGQASTAIPVVNATEQSAKAPEPPLELTLEDPVVDDMLTAPPPPPPAPAAPSVPAAAVTPKAESPADVAAARAAARVPIAKTASLTAAATKLAAASGAPRPGTRSAAARSPESATKSTPQAGAPGESAAKTAASAAKPAATAAMAKSDPAAPKLDAPSLASWASARAAAAPKVRPAAPPTAAAAPAASPPSIPRSAPPRSSPAPSAAVTPPTVTSAVPPAPVMDRDFIARNQVVERYLSGRLPLKAATEFERFCRDHSELLDEIGLPERVNAGVRLLEASGKPEPWQEAPRPVWQKPQVTLALAVAVIVLLLTLGGLAANSSSKSHRIAELQKQNSERSLDPATSTREIRLVPSRTGASNAPAIVIGGGTTQLADFKIDESRSPYHTFRVTIDRIDQGRVAIISNLDKDSNGHLRIALNSSALGPGNYQLTLEGLDWRGQPQPDSWVTIGIQR
jgi:hypothetical protein